MTACILEFRLSKWRVHVGSTFAALILAIGVDAEALGQEEKHAKLPGRILGIAALEAEQLAGKVLPYGLVSVEPNSGEWNKLFDIPTGVGEPTISRDGRHCFFMYYDGTRRGVLMVDIKGEAGQIPKHVSAHTGSISCGQDGRELIISARDNSARQKRMDAQRNEKQKSGGDQILSVKFPPAGHWRIRLHDGSEQKLNIPGEFQIEDWSPDGEWLVATTWKTKDAENGGYGDLYLMRADGAERRRLTNQRGGCSWPRFSPDGKHIAYSYSDNSENNGSLYSAIRIFSLESQQDRELIGHRNAIEGGTIVPPSDWYYFPAWSPDNAWLAVVCEQTSIGTIRRDSMLLLISKDGDQVEELSLAVGAGFSPGPRRVYWQ